MILRCGRLRLPKHSRMFQPLRMFDFFGDRQQTFQNAKSGYLECYIGHLEWDTNSPTNKIDEPSKQRWLPKPWQSRHPSSPYLRATPRHTILLLPNNYVAQKKAVTQKKAALLITTTKHYSSSSPVSIRLGHNRKFGGEESTFRPRYWSILVYEKGIFFRPFIVGPLLGACTRFE